MAVILRKYAATSTINFPLIGLGTVNFTSTATLTTADMKISVDGAAFTTVGTAITNVGSYGYSYSLTTANLTGKLCTMIIVSTAATKVCEDTMILIETYGNSGAQHTFDLSIANQTVIASAGTVTLTGGQLVTVGTISAAAVGAGLLSAGAFGAGFISAGGVAAAALSAGGFAAGFLSAGGVAAGAISAGGIATDAIDADALAADAVTEIWGKAAVEPTAVPAVTVSMLSTISWLLALSRNKISQTSTEQTLFADTTTNTIAISSVSDDGTTFTRAEFTS